MTASAASTALSIQLDPVIQVAEINESVTFTCRVIGNHPFDVHARWYNKTSSLLNSSDLTEDTDILSLLVTIKTDRDYQDYTCAIDDGDNTTITATAVLSELIYACSYCTS